MNTNFVKNGVLLAIVSIIISMALYLINPAMMFGSGAYLALLIPILFMIKSAREEKRDNEGYLSFGEGLKVTILTAAVGLFISSIFTFVLMTVIDPGLVDILKEQTMANADSMVDMMGGDENLREQMMDAIEEQDVTPTVATTLFNYFGMLIPYFIVSLIIAAIMKKEDKSFA